MLKIFFKFRIGIAFSLALSIMLTSCMSSTVITANAANATVYIDGVHSGKTPVTMKNKKVITTCTDIRIEKDGYETMLTQICRDEAPDLGPIVAGFCITIPWLWGYKYYPSHYYALEKKDYTVAPEYNTKETEDPAAGSNTKTEKSVADQLKDLKSLYDQGLITDDEYKKAKAEILGID
ncbi:MAG: hypothetical protein ACI9U0_000181 [Flavobacteriales bacterium]|jgi:hypothetical protein|tara:strand:- start:4202 stop:4738 length:537 start_codon:yes stop_codon:yes gene_type:complete